MILGSVVPKVVKKESEDRTVGLRVKECQETRDHDEDRKQTYEGNWRGRWCGLGEILSTRRQRCSNLNVRICEYEHMNMGVGVLKGVEVKMDDEKGLRSY